MRRRLLASYLTITLVTLLILIIPFGLVFSSRERDHLLRDIEHDAGVVAGLVEDALERGDRPQIDALLTAYDHDPGGRIVVVDASARSVADSLPPGTTGVPFANRPEIVAALKGARAEGIRRSNTLGTDLLFVAVPVTSSGVVHGAVRITYPSSALDERVQQVWVGLGALAFVVIAVVAAVGFAMARLVTRPVDRLKDAARSLAAGDLQARAPTDTGAPELRELATIFNDTAAHLETIIESQQSFVADASHQLRTPLAALRLQLENIEAGAPTVLQPALAAARSETARLSRISEALLSLARDATTTAPRQAINAAALIRERAALWTPLASDARVHIETSVPENAWILAVPGALEQILDNLIDNAIEVAPATSVVRVTIEEHGSSTQIHVIDNGPGIPDDQRARAFDRFWRGPAAAPGGSGLGLSIVAQLAQRCGGGTELRAHRPSGIDAVVSLQSAKRYDGS